MKFLQPMGLAPLLSIVVLAGCSPARGCLGGCGKKPESHSQENRTPPSIQDKSYPALDLKGLERIVATREATVVDANGSESYAEGHIPGALDFEALAADLPAGMPADRNAALVVYCGGPRCMAWRRAADALSDLGYTRISHYPGGLMEWQAAGKPLEGSPAETLPITPPGGAGRIVD
jgi:rhodanese-related sulfurtransferase